MLFKDWLKIFFFKFDDIFADIFDEVFSKANFEKIHPQQWYIIKLEKETF